MKNKVLTYIFIIIISLAGIAATILPDIEATFSERRFLYAFEELKVSEDFSGDFEKYALDHFILRDLFRRIKAYSEYAIFRKSDNNELYKYNDFISCILYTNCHCITLTIVFR